MMGLHNKKCDKNNETAGKGKADAKAPADLHEPEPHLSA